MSRDYKHLIGNKHALGSTPNVTAFKPGMVPWNKGLKGWSALGTEKTQFKKGQPGRNWVPVGTIRIRLEKRRTKRRFIKVREPNVWTLVAVKLWEEAYGPVPRGCVVHHIDRDTVNDTLSNLCLLTRAAHLKEHRLEIAEAASKSPKRYGWGNGGKREKN